MSKYSNKKALISTIVAMLMVLSAFVVITGSASATASGTVTYNVTTYGLSSVSSGAGTPVTTITFVSGGTFSSGATVYFYLSTSDSSSGLSTSPTGYSAIGETNLTSSSPTSLNQPVTFFPGGNVLGTTSKWSRAPAIPEGQYYILASDSSPSSVQDNLASGTVGFAFPSSPVQFVPQTAALYIYVPFTTTEATGSNALTVGSTGEAYGTGWDAGATVNIYLNYPGSSILLTTTTANSFGSFMATFTVPNLSGTVEMSFSGHATSISVPYNVVAQEMNTYTPVTYPQGGITSFSEMDVAPSITVSPLSISMASGATLTVTGTGFPANGLIPASTSITPNTYIQIWSYNYNGLSSALPVTIFYPQVNVSATGQFTVTLTIENSLTPYGTGPYGISMQMNDKYTLFTPVINQFYPAFYVSAPNTQELGFYFLPTPYPTSSGYVYYPMNPVEAAVFDFPANAQVSVYIGNYLVGNITTDSNGFGALPITATIPAMPAGTYNVVAVDSAMNLVASPTIGMKIIMISAFFQAIDPINNALIAGNTGNLASFNTNEYVPQNGTITVIAYGLTPMTPYNVIDSAVGPVFPLYVTAVQIGTPYGNEGIFPAANGTLEFSYSPYYGYYGITTGTLVSLTMPGVRGFLGLSIGYYEIGAPVIITSKSVTSPGVTGFTVTVSNLIPSSGSKAPVTFYPGTAGYYNVYLGSSKVTSSVPPVTSIFTPSSSGAFTATFTVPSMVNGVYNASVTYAGQPVSSALPPESSALVVVSTPGTSATSGTMITIPMLSGGNFNGYLVAGFGFLPDISPTLTVYGSNGVISVGKEPTDNYGGFADANTLNLNTVLSQSAGTYELVLSEPFGTSTYEFYASYSITSSLMFQQTTLNPNAGTYNGVFYDFIGDTVTLTATGLVSGTYYDAYLGTTYVGTFLASPTMVGGILEYSLGTFSVPIVPYGQYYFNLTYTGTMKVAASALFYVLPDYLEGLSLSSAQGIPIETAFPGLIVSFSWLVEPTKTSRGATFPSVPGSTLTVEGITNEYGSIYVTVYLNGTAYTTFPATYSEGYLNGSFLAPNAPKGTYWGLTLSFTQTVYTNSSSGGSLNSSGIYSYSSGQSPPAYFQIIRGAGALMMNISSSQVATIVAAVNSAVSTSMQVPLSELNAAITSLNATVVKISTSFGEMTTTLQAINATVTGIANGMATVKTDLGTVQTSLANLNATVLGISNNVVLLNTAVGQVQTTLNAINATLLSVNNGVMTLKTDAGTLMASVSALNATVSSINGNVATIMTNAGKVMASLSALNATLASVNGTVVTINTNLGSVQTSLSSISSTVTSTASSVSSLQGSVATIQTSLGTISGTITSVSNGVATIQTSLGTLQTNVTSIKTSTSSTASSVSSTLGWEIGVLVLVIITLVLVLIVIMQVSRISKQFKPKEEKKTPEEKTEEKKEGQ